MRAEFKPPFRMRAPTWLGSRHIDPCFVFMCVCAQRTGTSLPLYGTSAADCTATGAASPVRPRLALGAWASNPFWPMGRRALRAKRGASAKETAEACRSGGPRTGTEPSARGALDEPSTRNTIRQPPRGGQIVTGRQATHAVIGGGMMARHTNRNRTMARRWPDIVTGQLDGMDGNPPQMLIDKYL